MSKEQERKFGRQRGQTFLEIVVAVGLLSILFHATFTLVGAGLNVLGDARARLTARHLAQAKIEEIRNMPFEEVGTIGGIPAGEIPQRETVARNGLDYLVRTTVVYVDDPFDGLAPEDTLPTDYKRVRVEVNWSGLFNSVTPVVLLTDIAPPGVESTEGGGTIRIRVFNAEAVGVPEAEVHIVNEVVTPTIDLTIKTNEEGEILLPGAPACATCYFISATKEGYTEDRTYSSDEVANPTKPYLTVVEGQVSEISLVIDLASTLVVKTVGSREEGFPAVGGVGFHLRGTKIIGTDAEEMPVYKIDDDYTTGENGELVLEEMEWDSYELWLTGGDRDIGGSNPFLPLELLPNSEVTLQVVTVPHTANSLLVRVKTASGSAVASASAHLFNQGGTDEQRFTGGPEDPDFGHAFFNSLGLGEYTLETTASGFLDDSRTVNVSGQTEEEVVLQTE